MMLSLKVTIGQVVTRHRMPVGETNKESTLNKATYKEAEISRCSSQFPGKAK